ncbi:MAG: hypothetical protein IJJ28_07975 [Lentisphaeria bacterium]|nr:hypothetical protein [Lentisphaeria bacterium]
MKRIIVFAAVMLVLAATVQAAPLKIGWAMNDISTDEPVYLSGTFHARVSKGVRDPLKVTALAIDNGEDCVVFVSLDLIHTMPWGVKIARDIIAKTVPDLPPEKILFNATHTHTGVNEWRGDKAMLERYHNFLGSQIAKTVTEAWNSRKPGKIAYGYDLVVTAFNRRIVYFTRQKGSVGMNPGGCARLHGNTNTPDFSHVEGGGDPFVNYLFTYDLNDKLTGAIMNVPYTAQCSIADVHLSSDTWHDVRQLMAKRHPGIFILPQVAAAGEATFEQPYYKAAERRRNRLIFGRTKMDYPGEFPRKVIADRMLTSFDRALAWAQKEKFSDLPIKHVTKTLHLTRHRPNDELCAEARKGIEEIKALRKDPKTSPRMRTSLGMRESKCRQVLAMRKNWDKDPKYPMEFHALRIGDIGFVSEQFELYFEFGQRIAARSPFVQTFVIQLSVGGGGYLATERAEKNGGYGTGPLIGPVAPKGGQEFVEAAVAELKALKAMDAKADKTEKR